MSIKILTTNGKILTKENSLISVTPVDLIEAVQKNELLEYGNTNWTKIKDYTFYDCTNLKKIYFPNVTNLGYASFRNSGIIEADFPNVTTINQHVFWGCNEMKIMKTPKLKKCVNSHCMDCKKLETVYLNSVTEIDGSSFNNCLKLKDVYFGIDGVVILKSTSVFSSAGRDNLGYVNIHVKAEYADQYITATNWSDLITAGKIVIIGDYTNE